MNQRWKIKWWNGVGVEVSYITCDFQNLYNTLYSFRSSLNGVQSSPDKIISVESYNEV